MLKQMIICIGCTVGVASSASAGGDELAKAVKAMTTADSYRFTVQDGMLGAAVEVKFHKDAPLYCKADGIEFFRKGEVLVYKEGEAWQRTRTGTLSDPLRILGPSAKVRAVRLPHEELTILVRSLTKVTKVEAKMGVFISGEFTEETAKKLARTEDRDNARHGTAKFRLDGEGRLIHYEIAIRIQGKRGNAEVDGTVTRTVTLDGLGATKVDVPAAAKKALD